MGKWWNFGTVLAATIACTVLIGRKAADRKRNAQLAKGKRFVIVGGGFGGTGAAGELARLLPEAGDNSEIILIDRNDYLLFTPMLTEAVGATIESHHIIVPLKSFSSRIHVVKGVVKAIDLATKTVTFEDEKLQPITADYLVLSLGSTSNFHGIAGVEDAAYTLKTFDDANGIRQNALEMVKAASAEKDPDTRQANLTFVMAGGGYTGVEGIAALNELVRDAVAEYPALDGTPVRTVLVEPADRLMSEVTEDLATYSQKQLEKAGVRVVLKVGIKGVKGDELGLANGERIRASTLIWAAGIRPNHLVSDLGAATGKSKGLKVNGTLALPDVPGVWAMGDCAEVPTPDGKGHYAPTAQNASREGTLVAQNIVRSMRGEQQKPFKYTPVGELALVGKRKGVARVYGMNFSGFIAYTMWRGVYLMKMPSMAQRLRVLSDWSLDFFLGPTGEYRAFSAHSGKKLVEAK